MVIRVAVLFVLMVSSAFAQDVVPAGVPLRGLVIDFATRGPLANAQIFARNATGLTRIGTTNDSGRFWVQLPHAATSLVVRHDRYQAQQLGLPTPAWPATQAVGVLLPLLPLTGQGLDKTYLQIEQTSFVQNDTSHTQAKPANRQLAVFTVTDVLRNTPIQASIDLFFTRDGQKKKYTTRPDGTIEVHFDQKDIVAIEASAPGYQAYAGNLVVEQVDGRRLHHSIRMQRLLTVLALEATGATTCSVQINGQQRTLIRLSDGLFSTYELSPGQYELRAQYGSQLVRQPMRLHSGLNPMRLSGPASGDRSSSVNAASLSTTEPTQPISPDSLPVIYFEQSSYQLTQPSQAALKQLAAYLKRTPGSRLAITGHTDNVGNEQLNQTLSHYRAMVTASFLTRLGISDDRLIKTGVGSRQPLVPNDNESNRALNRCVSLTLLPAQ